MITIYLAHDLRCSFKHTEMKYLTAYFCKNQTSHKYQYVEWNNNSKTDIVIMNIVAALLDTVQMGSTLIIMNIELNDILL